MTIHYSEDNFGSIVQDSDGTLWFGTRTSGAYEFDGREWVQHAPGLDLRPELIDRQGNVWAVSDTAGAFFFDGETWQQLAAIDGLVSNTVYDVFQAHDGSLWFATDAGVSRYVR